MTFKDTMSRLMWTRQRYSPVPTKLFFFLIVIMACICHCRLIVGSKAIVQIDRILFGICDLFISLGLVQYPIDSRQVRIDYSARIDRGNCSTDGTPRSYPTFITYFAPGIILKTQKYSSKRFLKRAVLDCLIVSFTFSCSSSSAVGVGSSMRVFQTLHRTLAS